MNARDDNGPQIRGVEAIDQAIALYIGNVDLLLAARKPAILRQVRDDFHALQQAIAAHAPWAPLELLEVLLAHTELCDSLAGGGGHADLLRLQDTHARVLRTLRTFVIRIRPPSG